MPRSAHPKTGIADRRIFEMRVVDSTGVEYDLTLTVVFDRLERLARRLFKSEDGTAAMLEGAIIGKISRTGRLIPVDRRAVLRRRVRDGATEEVDDARTGAGE